MQSSSKEVAEEGQQYVRMESFEKPVLNENGFPEKMCWCLYVQSFLSTPTRLWVNWLQNYAIIWKIWSRSGFVWKESWLHVCSMPSIWLKQQNNILFKKWNPSVLRQMFCKKIVVRLNFIKSVLYLFTYGLSASMVFFFRNCLVFIALVFEEVKSLCWKQMPWSKNENEA